MLYLRSEGVAMHHLRSVRQLVTQKHKHGQKPTGFEFIKDQLKRTQISVCKTATLGVYNKQKPIHYHNPFLRL